MTIPSGYEESLKRVFISLIDITKNKRSKLKLIESEEKYHEITER